jgi:hypothetical protein
MANQSSALSKSRWPPTPFAPIRSQVELRGLHPMAANVTIVDQLLRRDYRLAISRLGDAMSGTIRDFGCVEDQIKPSILAGVEGTIA